MEFTFPICDIFKEPICEINQTLIPPGFKGDKRAFWDTTTKVSDIVNKFGEASAKAQGLTKPITTADRLRNSEHKIYFLTDNDSNGGKGTVVGMIKLGNKSLYVFDRNGHHYQVSSPCVLDFYIHESHQRAGLGKHLYEYVLKKENLHPAKLAIDRPSDKFLSFLNKHYSLQNPIKQMNNFVVFDGFFPPVDEKLLAAEKLNATENGKSALERKESANGLQSANVHLYGRYGAPRPPCSMGQIIHNQTSVVSSSPTPATVGSAADTSSKYPPTAVVMPQSAGFTQNPLYNNQQYMTHTNTAQGAYTTTQQPQYQPQMQSQIPGTHSMHMPPPAISPSTPDNVAYHNYQNSMMHQQQHPHAAMPALNNYHSSPSQEQMQPQNWQQSTVSGAPIHTTAAQNQMAAYYPPVAEVTPQPQIATPSVHQIPSHTNTPTIQQHVTSPTEAYAQSPIHYSAPTDNSAQAPVAYAPNASAGQYQQQSTPLSYQYNYQPNVAPNQPAGYQPQQQQQQSQMAPSATHLAPLQPAIPQTAYTYPQAQTNAVPSQNFVTQPTPQASQPMLVAPNVSYAPSTNMVTPQTQTTAAHAQMYYDANMAHQHPVPSNMHVPYQSAVPATPPIAATHAIPSQPNVVAGAVAPNQIPQATVTPQSHSVHQMQSQPISSEIPPQYQQHYTAPGHVNALPSQQHLQPQHQHHVHANQQPQQQQAQPHPQVQSQQQQVVQPLQQQHAHHSPQHPHPHTIWTDTNRNTTAAAAATAHPQGAQFIHDHAQLQNQHAAGGDQTAHQHAQQEHLAKDGMAAAMPSNNFAENEEMMLKYGYPRQKIIM